MSEDSSDACNQSCFKSCKPETGDNSRRPLATVEQKRSGRQALAAGSQYIGCTDITGPDRPHIAKTGGAGQQRARGEVQHPCQTS